MHVWPGSSQASRLSPNSGPLPERPSLLSGCSKDACAHVFGSLKFHRDVLACFLTLKFQALK